MNGQVDDVIGHILNSIKDAGLKKDPFLIANRVPYFPAHITKNYWPIYPTTMPIRLRARLGW